MENLLNALGAQISIITALLWVGLGVMLSYTKAFYKGRKIGYDEGYIAGKFAKKRAN